jgi:signal transduction histidine kinase
VSGLAVPVAAAGAVDAAPGAARAAAPESPVTPAAPPSAAAHDPDVLGFLERDDRLAFERGRLRFRLALLIAPALLLISYGALALSTVVLTCAVILLSTAAIAALLQRAPETLLRHQLWVRLVDVLSIFIVLTSARQLADASAAAEYFDATYLLTVISATATHGRRGTYTAGGAATLAVAAERVLEALRTGIPIAPVTLFSAGFYGVLFVISGLMVSHLMRTSGAVVARRDRAWEEQLWERNVALEESSARLAESNKELEAFAYSVSHDLRAPLRSIDGFSRIVQDRYAALLDATGQDYLRRVRAASQRMGQLIDDLLALSRVSRAELRRERLDVTALAEAVVIELCERQPERDVRIAIQPGMEAAGDPSLIRVALENLIGNAWKFSGKRERAEIEVGTLGPMVGRGALGAPERRTAGRLGGLTVFFVRDNGAGFEMAYADKLFGAFQRLHGAADFEGTGVGLATVQRIVRRHNGWVWAEAEPDQGATFYFALPSA